MIGAILHGLWRKPVSSLVPRRSAYRIFTPWFDREVRADELNAVLGPLSTQMLEEQDASWATVRDALIVPATRRVKPRRAGGTVVTLLLDQSGSMRGRPMALAAAAIMRAVRLLTARGVGVEVLGFTTASWRGGRPRRLWKRLLRPARPGRLCELLHVVYRDADATAPDLAEGVVRAMLRPDLPKENIDGEALLWAADRLLARDVARRILVVISDGSPVDDSSQQANGPLFLDVHLREVIAAIAVDGRIELAALGVGHDVSGWYPRSSKINSPADLQKGLTDFLAELIAAGET